MRQPIPGRIIQTGKTANLPTLSRASAATMKLLNPGFEYLFFDDAQVEDFIKAQPPAYRDAFYRFPIPIQRFDFFRYLAVYTYGGFYFDTDVFLAAGLSDLLPFGCVFPFEALTVNRFLRERHGFDWEVGNYAFGAAAGHPFLRAIIEACIRGQDDPAWSRELVSRTPALFQPEFSVLCTTGPGLVTRTLAEFPNAAENVHVLFPDDVSDERSWNHFGTYGVHTLEGTWRNRKRVIRRRLFALWREWERKKVLTEARRRGPKRELPR